MHTDVYTYTYIYFFILKKLFLFSMLASTEWNTPPKHIYVRSKTQSYMQFLHKYILKK